MNEDQSKIPPILTSRPEGMDYDIYKTLLKLQKKRIKVQLKGQPCTTTKQEQKEPLENSSSGKDLKEKEKSSVEQSSNRSLFFAIKRALLRGLGK
jgi:hypothetical protein